jgi:hypothetical protein
MDLVGVTAVDLFNIPSWLLDCGAIGRIQMPTIIESAASLESMVYDKFMNRAELKYKCGHRDSMPRRLSNDRKWRSMNSLQWPRTLGNQVVSGYLLRISRARFHQ